MTLVVSSLFPVLAQSELVDENLGYFPLFLPTQEQLIKDKDSSNDDDSIHTESIVEEITVKKQEIKKEGDKTLNLPVYLELPESLPKT